MLGVCITNGRSLRAAKNFSDAIFPNAVNPSTCCPPLDPSRGSWLVRGVRPQNSVRFVLLAAAFATVAGAAARGSAPRAEAILSRLESDAASKSATAGAVSQARKALERSRNARAAGDQAHAEMLDDLALEWAELGQDTVRATQSEAQAEALERQLLETETKTVRARALLEETIARRGRAREKLEQLESAVAPATSAAPPSAPPKPASAPPSAASAVPAQPPKSAAPKAGGGR